MSVPCEYETAIVADFIEMTGLDFEVANHYLQAAHYDISIAYSLLPEETSTKLASNASAPSRDMYSQSKAFEDTEHVRAADPVQQQRLVGGVFRSDKRDDTFARRDDSSVVWIFPPPDHINFPSSLQEVR